MLMDYDAINNYCTSRNVTVLAVSKKKSDVEILEIYNKGHRLFGENYVQELVSKSAQLPKDIQWHFIGHLQRNKVKLIVPFVSMIQSVDSFELLLEINKHAEKCNRVIDVLLQAYVADEETKFGMDANEMLAFMEYYEAQKSELNFIRIRGIMGMATFTQEESQIIAEMQALKSIFQTIKATYFIRKPYFDTCSMGMSSDFKIAIDQGSTMVRVGSSIFGSR
jgi:pyridoxal phosphate enzyme (YggS family)